MSLWNKKGGTPMSTTPGPKSPSRPTFKRLFGLSGNRCAFPDCSTRLVDRATGSIVGEACHIKGEKPTAARYDANQTNAERHDFENLILLCGCHHKVIDDNAATYTLELLQQMKKDHEARFDGKEAVSEEDAERFASAATYIIEHGSLIIASNITGGQVAHSITNNYIQTPQAEEEKVRVVGQLSISGDASLIEA